MSGMFYGCSCLTSLDVSRFDMTNVTTMKYMFQGCSSLTTIYCDETWNAEITSDKMFTGCTSLPGYSDDNANDASYAKPKTKGGYFTSICGDLLIANDVKLNKGQQQVLTISLENETTDFAAYQFDLTLPEGFTLLTDDNGKVKATLGSRYGDSNQSLIVEESAERHTYRFLCFSMLEGVIEGNSGPLFGVTIVPAAEQSEGNYQAVIRDVTFTRAGGVEVALADASFNIEMTGKPNGDANGDGKVNVSDIVEIMNYITGMGSDVFDKSAADVNGDGVVNIADILMMVNIIMSASVR